MKFAISITIYVWTVAWMLEYLPRPQRWIEWGTAAAMIVEIVCIAGQAARGTTSHFNQTTPFDAVVFAVMGIAIAFNIVLAVRILWLFRGPVAMPPAMVWGVRLGLALFLAGSADGVAMIAHGPRPRQPRRAPAHQPTAAGPAPTVSAGQRLQRGPGRTP